MSVLTKQNWIANLADRKRGEPITSIHHLINLDWLLLAYDLVRKDGALGIDKQSAACYAQNLEANLIDLLARIKSGKYKAPPVKRVFIPKSDGKQRPLGIPTFEDKIVQRAIVMLLEPIFEQEFLDCSFGFRKGCSAHQALKTLRNSIMDNNGRYILEVDIKGFFDNIDHSWLLKAIKTRVNDGVVIRLLCKWLKAGISYRGILSRAKKGTPQGGIISPLLSNIMLHYILDLWFFKVVRPRLQSSASLIRYCDDFVIVFSNYKDCKRVYGVLGKRFEKFGLTLHEGKTKIVDFRHSPKRLSDFPTSFDFLGFTHVWKKSKNGKWVVLQRTAKDRLSRSLKSIKGYCQSSRHKSLKTQCQGLQRRMMGHYAYFGITGNSSQLRRFHHSVTKIWHFWLSKRHRGNRIKWDRFKQMISKYQLPEPRIVHQYTRV